MAIPLSSDMMSAERRRETTIAALTGAAILAFVVIGGAAMIEITGHQARLAPPLLVALLLNIALILFGWRKHRDLMTEAAIRIEVENRAVSLAQRDPLTGLLNRRSLIEDGSALFVRAHRRSMAMALLVVDLDAFKTVNDTHGHAAGDLLLRATAETIAAALPGNTLVARFGGDEFACALLFDPGRPDTVEAIADRLLSALAQPRVVGGHRIQLSASIGIARSDADCASMDALMRAADMAMYAAKKAGRARYAWFDRPMEEAFRVRAALESALRSAIPAGEIVPYFERQVELASGRLSGFEVLARWQHPTRGTIAPDVFIPIAEQAGLIGDLSLSVMRQAFVAAGEWDAGLTLAINISPSQLRDPWLAQKIIKTLTETGFPAARLEIEITESALLDNLPLAQSIVASLKNQGIRIALDDFGTGYSSLAHLRALPFDRIKIDRSFVTSINSDAESAAIVAAVTGLGASLNLPVTAEGIEDEAIEARLKALGCGKGQGYLYGRPLAIGDVRRLLASERLLAQPGGGDLTTRRAS